MDVYLPLLAGKKVAIVTNQTGMVDDRHLVDTLLSRDVKLLTVFAPEHGFRGDADAGEKIGSYVDPITQINVVSLYGSSRKPRKEDISRHDVILFDIQDVGLRYFTYISTLHYVMQTCAETGVPLIILDRPNPNGMYVDGPVIEEKYRSFVGMHPIPVVHGMTLGELAQMINGEGWIKTDNTCEIKVITCLNYTHASCYELPVKPSPNLPNMRSIYLYPAICCLEGTVVSLGRGTDFPFQIYGHPTFGGLYSFKFTPRSVPGAKNPPLKDKTCYGMDLRTAPDDETVITRGVDLTYVIDCYNAFIRSNSAPQPFFNSMFEKLLGASYIRPMIEAGKTNEQIRVRWQTDVADFRAKRKPYLLYDE
jgi:uncharacterized protein YbbC (DUF1343 family)